MSVSSLETLVDLEIARRTDETRWETGLFAMPASVVRAERISARAAYQLALFGRGVIVDIRAGAERRAEGAVHARLSPLAVPQGQVRRWMAQPWFATRAGLRPDTRLIVLTQDGSASAEVAQALRTAGFAQATDIVDGFRGWCAAGLPTAVLPIAGP